MPKGGFLSRLFPCFGKSESGQPDPGRAERARLAAEIEASALGLDPPGEGGPDGGEGKKKKRKKRRFRSGGICHSAL